MGNDFSTAELEKIMNKESFTKYNGMHEWIIKSPKVTNILEDTRGKVKKGEKWKTKTTTGFDCNRDGKVDGLENCISLYQALAKNYHVKINIKLK